MSVAPSQPRRLNTFDVYVGNLPADTDQRRIGKLFSAYGEVHNIWINISSDGNKYGLVKFYNEEDGLKAIEETNGMIFEGGKPILVKKAVKRGVALMKKDGGGESEGSQEREDGKLAMSVKQRNPDIVPMFESSSGLPHKREMENLLISYVETPIIMWGQKLSMENVNELANIVEQLALTCPEAPRVTGKPENDKIYGAQYSDDNCWYRCIVRYTFHSERVKVQYIDFGNTEELNPSNLVELPKSLSALPPCAMKFVLHSLWCNNNQDPSAIKFVKDMVEGKEVDAYTTARLSDHTGFFAEIYFDGVCLNEKMLESNFAFKKPGLEQRGMKGRGQIQEGDANSNNNSFKAGMLNQRDGPRKFETEKDEINNLRWKLKNLQSEYASLSNKAQENDLSTQIKNLQELSSMVRKLRNQFPIDKDTPLDVAIALVQSPHKIDVSMAGSLPEVISAINACKSAQDEILKCSDNTILTEKIETRDTLRRDLHDKLNTTIQELNQVPLQDRGRQVQEVVAALSKHYDTFTKIPISNLPSIDSLLPTFEEWKMKKKGEVIEARRISDMMESIMNAAFVQLKSQISISSDCVEEEPSEDLDSTLKNYTKSLQQEVSVSDTENSPDAIFVGSLVQALLRELSEECVCVDHLTNVYHEFSALKEQITPWLNSKPTTDELQAVKSKLKTLKSKLRHKLADKMDAEENQDTAEMEEIAKDLEEIRNKIHKALTEENRLMSELSQLASAHFPELLNSDTGFNQYMTYKGLVKESYAPDHYTMTSVGSSSSGMFVSHFDGEPVFIKEYFLSNGNHLDKDEFLSRMALYTNASSSNLEPISAVFFDKNNRHAYVQVKKQGELLSTLVDSLVVTKQHCQSIIGSIARALQALNLFNFVHGQVQPEFILVDEEGNAKLLPPDFSLTDADRCRSRYTTSSGVDIMAPEMKQNMILVEPGHSVDIYCLGLLALWMHYPTTSFFERKEGTLDFSSLPMDRKLGIFLMKLLSPNSLLRPSAEHCLRSEYLTQPVVTESRPVEAQPPYPTAYGGSQDPSCGRNSASPASVLSHNSSDGLVYAESGAGVQMIANTRVPPPPIAGDNLNQTHSASTQFSGNLPSGQPQGGPIRSSPLQFQQQQQYHQFMQQQQQQQQQQCHVFEAAPSPHHATTADDSGSFEIGTFDPNAYEVVTSPQPSNAVRHEEQSDGAEVAKFQDTNGSGHELVTANDDDDDQDNEDDLEDMDNAAEKEDHGPAGDN